MDILRFITAGNVDDGKSTLIGRLLYDTKNITSDVLQSVSNENDDEANINLAHITDGLRAERQQGVTIDVAYKYFTTKNRKYIITDAPGHIQYTKNLVTGASGTDVMIILIDGVNGITEQTRRHSMVASFLKIKQVVIAVNKMDLVNYDERRFAVIKDQYLRLADKLQLQQITFIPISALKGDNVSFHSEKMRWYKGKTLEQYLESCEPVILNEQLARFSIQYVIKEAGCYAGRILSGLLRKGDRVVINPGGHLGSISRINDGYNEVVEAKAGQNICIYMETDTSEQRGYLVSHPIHQPHCGSHIEIALFWLDADNVLQPGKEYYLRINALETPCVITEVLYKTDVTTFEQIIDDEPVAVNQFAKVKIKTQGQIAYDSHSILPENGRGIIIDAATNFTAGAFIIPDQLQ